MYIEAVTVCVHYSDFLAHTLPLNKVHFDHYVIITSRDDKETQKLCLHHNVECLITDRFTEGGQPFNKAKGINEGLLYQSKRDWMVHLDADIVLPAQFRKIVESMDLDKAAIYGCDRLMCPDFVQWLSHVKKPKTVYENWIYIHLDAFPVAARVADYNGKGYAPIGFFQMWHPQTSKQLLYPEDHGAADRTDMMFAKQWPRKHRHLLPELVVIHLDSENATVKQMGKNWLGRQTVQFGYEPDMIMEQKTNRYRFIITVIILLSCFAIGYAAYYYRDTFF
jgi:hypothetical protein